MQRKLKKFKFLLLAFVVGTIVLIYIFVYLPVHNELAVIFNDSFWQSSQDYGKIVNHALEDCEKDAAFLSSDHAMLTQIEDYEANKISLETLKEKLEQIYRNLADKIDRLTSAVRHLGNDVVCSYNDGTDYDISPDNDFLYIDDHTYFKVYSPIYSDSKQIGFDIAIFDLTDLLKNRIHPAKISSPEEIKRFVGNKAIYQTSSKSLFHDKHGVIYLEEISGMEYYLYIAASNATLYKPLRSIAVYFFIGITATLMLVALLTNFLVVKKAGRMIAISEKRKERYTKDSMRDPLSGAYSRRFFEEWIKKESKGDPKSKFHYSMVLLDVDRFKQINESCGHLSGDEAIRIVGSVLFACVRTTDYVIRYGGDEFMLLLNECSEAQAEDIMYRVCEKLKKFDTVPFEISISYGIQEIKSRNDILKALSQADRKMYEAKKSKVIS